MSEMKPALVGGFVLSGVALAVTALLVFGGSNLFRSTISAVVYFRGSVGGLDVGAPVTFRGVKVGTVTSIAVRLNLRDLTARIPVYLKLDSTKIALEDTNPDSAQEGFNQLLKAGLRAQLNMQSLITGQLRVDLDIHPGKEPAIIATTNGVPEIPSIPSQLQTLEDEIAALPLKEIAQNARDTLAATKRIAETLGPKVGPLMDSLVATSAAARQTLATIDGAAHEGKSQLKINGDQLRKVLSVSEQTVRDADQLVISLKQMTAANSQIRSNLDNAIRDLSESASSLRGFAHEIERDPSAIITGRTTH